MTARITFASGVGTVTGANFLLDDISGGKKYLIDCGLTQGTPGGDALNRGAFSYDPRTIDILFVTHAHIDHVGRIPKLVKDGFRGKIISTPVTYELSRLMLEDASRLIDNESREKGTLPMYEHKDVEEAFRLWESVEYHVPLPLSGGLSVALKDSGHILGSSMFEFKRDDRSVVFTGDLGNSPALFLRDTESVEGANYLVMESVYGDRNHESKDERTEKFEQIISDVVRRKGTLIIPAFSLERTQDILFELNDLVEKGKVPAVPVFVDSPLGARVTAVYARHKEYMNDAAQKRIKGGDALFDFPRLTFSMRSGDSLEIDEVQTPKIIIAGSGMSNGGRITRHEKRYLPDPNATLLLVGYQSLGTLGRKLQDGVKEVMIEDETIPVRAHLETILGYSSHKDSEHLIEFAAEASPTLDAVFVAMGEPKASLFLAQRLRDYAGIKAVCPEAGQMVEINI